jgi:hypothetical protein
MTDYNAIAESNNKIVSPLVSQSSWAHLMVKEK